MPVATHNSPHLHGNSFKILICLSTGETGVPKMPFSQLFTMLRNTCTHPKSQSMYTFSSWTFQAPSILSCRIYYSRNWEPCLWFHLCATGFGTFFINRNQWVRINDTISTGTTTNSGAPKGCVSPRALFKAYTRDGRPVDSTISKNHLSKYAGDMTLLGLIKRK